MQANKDPAELVENLPAQPEAENLAPRVYNCIGCRFVDSHGLVCGVCIRKILDDQAKKRQCVGMLIAACFDGRGCMTLLRSNRAAALV